MRKSRDDSRLSTRHSGLWTIAIALLLSLRAAGGQQPEVKRVVIIKVDGLPERFLEQYAAESAPGAGRAGHSRLPWIEHVFADNGTWLENFYVRGLSLSAPSWSLLDTGRHLEIRGNADYDRYTLRGWDYLNFFPFYVSYSLSHTADMPGVQLLDQQGVPLLIDRFPYPERYQSFQLFQRGARLTRLESMLKVKFQGQSPKNIFDEWATGFSMTDALGKEMERELLENIKNPNIHYLDFYSGDYDHVAHLTNDRVAQFHAIEAVDALVGRVWSAIERSPLASSTALVLVSDHGMNTQSGVYSQGYSLIDWFNSPAGGSHHVLTNRHPMTEFKLKGLDPFVSEVISPSASATYLAGDSTRYPTCVMDLDGNERASISLRNNSLNIAQILLDQLIRKRVTGPMRRAVIDALFATLDRVRPVWRENVEQLDAELNKLGARISEQQKLVDAHPKKWRWTKDEMDAGLYDEAARQFNRLDIWKSEAREYSAYTAVMRRLLALDPADFDPGKFKIEDLIPRKSLGEPNSIYDLQHYVTGIAPEGLELGPDGSLDQERSFRHVDYFTALSQISVRNNVQKEVGSRPIDFISVAVKNSVWLWRGADRQALIETRRNDEGKLELRYLPVAHVSQDASGELKYDRAAWASGLPLELFEDPNLEALEAPGVSTSDGTAGSDGGGIPVENRAPGGGKTDWLSEWHDEREWLRAVHRTKYSNGIIGIVEAMLVEPSATNASTSLEQTFLERQRQLRLPDMMAFSNDHWNFNVRGFNPGGNHGSFFRVSTHSVLMFAGGADTGIPRGVHIAEPYDSLSLVPTILQLMNRTEPGLPGPVIRQVVSLPAR
jgi:hypothetical protein